MDPMEPILGSFIYPDIPQKGAQFQARVRHLRTPNKVNTMIQERQYYFCIFSVIAVLLFLITITFSNKLN